MHNLGKISYILNVSPPRTFLYCPPLKHNIDFVIVFIMKDLFLACPRLIFIMGKRLLMNVFCIVLVNEINTGMK